MIDDSITSLERGRRITLARHNKGISQELLAELLGISRSQLQRLEQGKINQKWIETLKLASKILDIPPESLL